MFVLKNSTSRHRPAKNDRDWNGSVATSRKSFPLNTRILAEYDGTKSFPSGDVMMATLVAIPFWTEIGARNVAMAIVVSSALGRMYVLAHHLSDVTAGFVLAIGVHALCETAAKRLDFGGLRGTAWWHPLVIIGLFVWVELRSQKVKNPMKNQA